jgi:hypothetical protein
MYGITSIKPKTCKKAERFCAVSVADLVAALGASSNYMSNSRHCVCDIMRLLSGFGRHKYTSNPRNTGFPSPDNFSLKHSVNVLMCSAKICFVNPLLMWLVLTMLDAKERHGMCLVTWCVHHVTRHITPIYNILSTAHQLSISQKALVTLPEVCNVMPKYVGQRFPNFFQVGTTFISQNVLRTTLLLSSLKASCLRFSTTVCDTQFTFI